MQENAETSNVRRLTPEELFGPFTKQLTWSEHLKRGALAAIYLLLLPIVGSLFLVGLVLGSDQGARELPWLVHLFGIVLLIFVGKPLTRWVLTRFKQYAKPLPSRRPDKPLVLLLRSFIDDQRQSMVAGVLGDVHFATQEEELTQAFLPYADVVAVGRPAERLPPLGAMRLYYSDDIWQSAVHTLASDAALVILRPAQTKAVQWELSHLVENIEPTKVVIWNPEPGLDEDLEKGFLELLRAAGLQLTNPVSSGTGLGALLLFDKNWRPRAAPLVGKEIGLFSTGWKMLKQQAVWLLARSGAAQIPDLERQFTPLQSFQLRRHFSDGDASPATICVAAFELAGLGRAQETLTLMKMAKQRSADADVWCCDGWCLLQLGLIPEALASFEAAQAIIVKKRAPAVLDVQVGRACAMWLSGDTEHAASELRAALDLSKLETKETFGGWSGLTAADFASPETIRANACSARVADILVAMLHTASPAEGLSASGSPAAARTSLTLPPELPGAPLTGEMTTPTHPANTPPLGGNRQPSILLPLAVVTLVIAVPLSIVYLVSAPRETPPIRTAEVQASPRVVPSPVQSLPAEPPAEPPDQRGEEEAADPEEANLIALKSRADELVSKLQRATESRQFVGTWDFLGFKMTLKPPWERLDHAHLKGRLFSNSTTFTFGDDVTVQVFSGQSNNLGEQNAKMLKRFEGASVDKTVRNVSSTKLSAQKRDFVQTEFDSKRYHGEERVICRLMAVGRKSAVLIARFPVACRAEYEPAIREALDGFTPLTPAETDAAILSEIEPGEEVRLHPGPAGQSIRLGAKWRRPRADEDTPLSHAFQLGDFVSLVVHVEEFAKRARAPSLNEYAEEVLKEIREKTGDAVTVTKEGFATIADRRWIRFRYRYLEDGTPMQCTSYYHVTPNYGVRLIGFTPLLTKASHDRIIGPAAAGFRFAAGGL